MYFNILFSFNLVIYLQSCSNKQGAITNPVPSGEPTYKVLKIKITLNLKITFRNICPHLLKKWASLVAQTVEIKTATYYLSLLSLQKHWQTTSPLLREYSFLINSHKFDLIVSL